MYVVVLWRHFMSKIVIVPSFVPFLYKIDRLKFLILIQFGTILLS